MCPYWNKIQNHSSQKSYNFQRNTSWSSKIHMFTTENCLYAWLGLFSLFSVLEKKWEGKKGLPKARELNQNSSLFQTRSTCRLYTFWQTPYFKTGWRPLSFSQIIKSHQSSCDAQLSSPIPSHCWPHTPCTPGCTHAHLVAFAITWLSPSAHACQIFFVKHCIIYTTLCTKCQWFTVLFKVNLIYIFWRRILSLNKDI